MDKITNLKQKKLFLLDMDGTIYLEDKLFKNVLNFFDYIDSIGGKYIFLTNNSSKSVNDYIKKLNSFDIKVDVSNFMTSSQATGIFLKDNYMNKLIYVLGTNSFQQELASLGLNLVKEPVDEVDCLVVGFDTELTYKKLTDACKILSKNTDYLATNLDLVCPASFGFIPDCGSICEMLKTATGKSPQFIGKPNPDMVNLAIKNSAFSKNETIVIGDRLYTDIACGINAGVDTAIVLTGETKQKDLLDTEFIPTYVFKDISSLLSVLTNNNPLYI